MTNETTTTDVIETAKTEAVAQAKARQAAAKKAKAKKPAKAKAKTKSKSKTKAKSAKPATARADSKQARFIEAMRKPEGISITEAAKRFDWQPHTVRGAIAGAIKKRLGLKVEAEKDEKRGTVYRIAK